MEPVPFVKLLVGVGVFLVLFVAFFSTPNAVLGTDGDSLARSVNGGLISLGACRQRYDSRWMCAAMASGGSSTATYLVDVDWRGCWEGDLVGPAPQGEDKHPTGCVRLTDHIGLFD